MAAQFQFTSEQIIVLRSITDNGTKDFANGYQYIYDQVALSSNVNADTKFWFRNAIEINKNSDDSAANFFIRNVTKLGMYWDGKSISNTQSISDGIGRRVINDIIASNALPALDQMVGHDITVALIDNGMTIGGWGGAYYYWDTKYNGITVGEKILSNPAEYEKFISVNGEAVSRILGTPHFLNNFQEIKSAISLKCGIEVAGDILSRAFDMVSDVGDPNRFGSIIKLGGKWYLDNGTTVLSEVTDNAVVLNLNARRDIRIAKHAINFDNMNQCFSADTLILMADGRYKSIDSIVVGDAVKAFDGLGDLQDRSVVRIFHNTTEDWLDLDLSVQGFGRLRVTPGHDILQPDGTFKSLASLIDDTSHTVDVVLADASSCSVSYELVSRHKNDISNEVDWATFNFEVEGLHTYIAQGVRVHNKSIVAFIPKDAEVLSIGFNGAGNAEEALYVRTDRVIVKVRGLDINSDGNTDRLSETLYIPEDSNSAKATIVQEKVYDPITGREASRHVKSVVYNESTVQFERVGQLFGSTFGAALAGGNDLTKIPIATLIATLSQNVGEFLQKSMTSSIAQIVGDPSALTGTPLTDAAAEAFGNLGEDLTGNLRAQIVGSLSSVIMSELVRALGLKGTDGEIVSVVGSAVTNQLLNNISSQILSSKSNPDLFKGFAPEDISKSIQFALAGYFGSKLGDAIVNPETREAAIAGSVASAMGGYIGATLLSIVPVIGTFIGSFIGKILGNLFGNLFSSDNRQAAFTLELNSTSGDVFVGTRIAKDGADTRLSEGISKSAAAQINAIMDLADAKFDTELGQRFRGSTLGWWIDHKNQVFYADNFGSSNAVTLYQPQHWDDNVGKKPSADRIQSVSSETINQATQQVLRTNDIVSSDPYKDRAFYASRNMTLQQLGFDLKMAEDYKKYLSQKTLINALIAAEPTSQFSAAWVVTLQRAQELNLNKAGHSDFRAGFRGFTELLHLDEYGATLGDLSVTPQNGGLIVDVALRPEVVVPERIFDLYGGQAAIITENGERKLRFFLDAATLERGDYRGLSTSFAANGEGAAADKATPGGSIWQARGQQYLKTLWIGGDRQNDYRDSATYWETANNDPKTAGSDDILIGGSQRDNINGSAGRDWIQGGAGDDALYGDAGDDVITGGTGNDYLTGGSGADRFVFRDGFGYDAIADFEIKGGDRIEFGTADMRSFEEIMGLTKNTADGAIIVRNPESSILLKGVKKEDLRAEHFSLRPAPTISVADVKVMEGSGVIGTGDGFLHTEGNQIVDGSGNPFKIAGVNWFGLESKDLVPHGLYDRDWRSMMDQMKSLGFNTIRLPFASQTLDPNSRPVGGMTGGINLFKNQDFLVSGAYDYRVPIADQQAITSLEIMDKIIDYAGKIGLRIILDHHRSEVGISASENGLWYNTQYSESQWVSDWQMLAKRYAGNSTIIGADLHNEPHGKTAEGGATWGDGSPTDWRAAAEKAGNAIGTVNKDWLIFVEGIEEYKGQKYWWGGNLMGAKDYPVNLDVPKKLVYSPHDYPNSVFAQPWFSDPGYPNNLTTKFRDMWGYLFENNTAPVWLGEIGTSLQDPKDLLWLDKMRAYLNGDFNADGTRDLAAGKQGLSWTWWSWNPDSGDTGGILNDDWKTVNQAKLDKLRALMSPTTGNTLGKTAITFTISLSSAATETVTLDYKTVANGKAVAGGDFADISGSLTFNVGEKTKTVTTWVNRDNLDEGDETFSLVLTNAKNGVLGKAVAIATIANDDHAALTATAAITDDWGTGFVGQIKVKNSGSTLVDDGWTYQFDMPYEIREIWDAEIVSHIGTSYVVRNLAKNATIAAGQEISFGFVTNAAAKGDVSLIKFETAPFLLNGTALAETLNGRQQRNKIYAGGGNDIVTGWNESDMLDGQEGDDKLYGVGGDDRLYGGEGNDTLDGGAGADQINGGAGIDTASYWNSAQGVTINLLVGTAAGGEAQGDRLMSVENILGSTLADTLTGDAGVNRLEGNGGNDIIDGGAGNDALYGGDGDDQLFGRAGNDELQGGSGKNLLDGGDGDDTIYGGVGDDQLFGGAGIDKLYGNGGSDVSDGGAGNDELYGGAGNDVLTGGDGDDKLYGNGGQDRFLGGNGDDQIYGGAAVDIIDGGAGNDTVFANDGADQILGGAGADTLDGGSGNDTLTGGVGNDVLKGGLGSDRYVYLSGDGDDYLDETKGVSDLDTLALGAGFTAANVLISRSLSNRNDAIVSFTNGAGSITLHDQFGSSGIGIEKLEFVDGTGWDAGTIVQKAWLRGWGENDTIVGTSGADMIDGGAGNDILSGADGADILIGNIGNDTLTGGLGADRFEFYAGFGNDTITDFNKGAGPADVVMFHTNTFASFAGVKAAAVQQGSDVMITQNGANSLRLKDTTLSSLAASSFNFLP